MDFVIALSRSPHGYDAIWVIVDRLTKSAHFLAMHLKDSIEVLIWLNIQEIIHLHDVLVTIVLDRDPRFISLFLEGLQKALGTQFIPKLTAIKAH